MSYERNNNKAKVENRLVKKGYLSAPQHILMADDFITGLALKCRCEFGRKLTL